MNEEIKLLVVASLGFAFGLLAEPIKGWLKVRQDMRRIRRLLYIEIGRNYISWKDTQTKPVPLTACYDEIKKTPLLFYTLQEANWLDHIYTTIKTVEPTAYEHRKTLIEFVDKETT